MIADSASLWCTFSYHCCCLLFCFVDLFCFVFILDIKMAALVSLQGVACLDRRTNQTVCSICKTIWKSVKVMPSSEYCWNFGDFDLLPIAPWPRGKPNKDPFEYCKKKDHFR